LYYKVELFIGGLYMSVKVIKTKKIFPLFEKTNLQYEVDYDYQRSACTCNAYETGDYCRCTKIERAWVESVNVKLVVKKLYTKYCQEPSELDEYCFDRICSALKIFDKSRYEVESCWGYYGEEIDGVYFEAEEKIVEAYEKVISLESDIEKIKFILELEYGYLIDRLTYTTSATIEEVNTEKIKLPQTEYFIKLSKDVVEDYKNRKLPVAVCIKNKDRYFEAFDTYTLIDGYHRFIANKDRTTNRIIVLE
jgi:hypothetical protein